MNYPKHIKAAVLTSVGEPLEIIDNIEVPELKPGHVLVEILFAGLCHSQLMEVRGKRGYDAWVPHMLGHEGTGVVIKTGKGVSKVKVGERVVLGWIKGQGMDPGGVLYRTTDGKVINAGGVTTFSDYTVVSENRLVSIPDGTPDDLGVLYGCALPTGAGIVMNDIKPEKGSRIAVLGLGGIGISALMVARLYNPSLLIAIDIEDSKLDLAYKLGATHMVNSLLIDPVQAIMDLTNDRGVDYVIEAAGLSSTISQGFAMVRRNGGRCIFASHPESGELVCIDPFEMISGKSLEGSWGGSSNPDRDIPIFGKHYSEGKIDLTHLISHTYTLENINDALDDLEKRKIVRALISISPD